LFGWGEKNYFFAPTGVCMAAAGKFFFAHRCTVL
jgi:hypothetical protein